MVSNSYYIQEPDEVMLDGLIGKNAGVKPNYTTLSSSVVFACSRTPKVLNETQPNTQSLWKMSFTYQGHSSSPFCGFLISTISMFIRGWLLYLIITTTFRLLARFDDASCQWWCLSRLQQRISMERRLIVIVFNQRHAQIWAVTIYGSLNQQRARKKGGAAGSWTLGLWLTLPVLCHWAMTPTNSHPSSLPVWLARSDCADECMQLFDVLGS